MKKHFKKIVLLLLVVISIMSVFLYKDYKVKQEEHKKSYSEFVHLINDKEIKNVLIVGNEITYTLIENDEEKTIAGIKNDDIAERLLESGIPFGSKNPSKIAGNIFILMYTLLPVGLILIVLNRGSGNNEASLVKESDVRFDDVAGQNEAKESLEEIIEYLKNPDLYAEVKVHMPKGVLLEGPPGTGKTLLAKAVAGEAGVPFYHITGSSFVDKFVGAGASNIRKLFKKARENAPAIIFIDEIDAVGSTRSEGGSGANMESNQTINELLAQMDGFSLDLPVIVLGATNRPGSLDPALTRTGRFDRKVIVDLPDLTGRVDILKVHTSKINLAENVDLKDIAELTPGASGSDLANIVNEAVLKAIRKKKTSLTKSDLMESFEFTLMGSERKNSIMSKNDKRIVSFHEAGHAVIGSILNGGPSIKKITIIPRTTGSLGYVMKTPRESSYLMSKEDLVNELVILMSGRAAEERFMKSVSTGAYDDISKATGIATDFVGIYGMSSKIGPVALYNNPKSYTANERQPNFNSSLMESGEREIHSLLNKAYKIATDLVEEYAETINAVALYLIENEVIDQEVFSSLLDDADYKDKESNQKEIDLGEIKVSQLESKPVKEKPLKVETDEDIKVTIKKKKEVVKEVEKPKPSEEKAKVEDKKEAKTEKPSEIIKENPEAIKEKEVVKKEVVVEVEEVKDDVIESDIPLYEQLEDIEEDIVETDNDLDMLGGFADSDLFDEDDEEDIEEYEMNMPDEIE